jgi:hypothetical protein
VQVWEESAAKHVSLAAQLERCAALATRWRRAEMRSWAGLLDTIASRHAAKSHRVWFSLYALLAGVHLNPNTIDVLSSADDANADAAMDTERQAADAMEAEGLGAPAALATEEAKALQAVAEGLQELMQGCSLGEFQRRLQTLWFFHAHLQLSQRVQKQQQGVPGT